MTKRIKKELSMLLLPQWVIFLGLFTFLLIRNWSVLTIVDASDGFYFKAMVVSNGINFNSLKSYIVDHAIRAYDQHFIPVWFLIFYVISAVFDNNPVLVGLTTFMVAALLLFFMFQIVQEFGTRNRLSLVAASIAVILFSSTAFFLEILTWKWMLSLLISSTAFYASIYLLLKRRSFNLLWRIVYVLCLSICMWTFGLGWIWVWGLVIFLFLKGLTAKRVWHKTPELILTATVAAFGTATVLIANVLATSQNSLNLWLAVSNFPSALAAITTNIILGFIGIFQFNSANMVYVSTVLGLVAPMLIIIFYMRRFYSGEYKTKDALVCSSLSTYALSIFLSLLRLTQTETTTNNGVNTYIFGSRYLFTYAVPLGLALGILLVERLQRFSKVSLALLLVGAVMLGVVVQANYAKTEPFLTNRKRNEFYNITSQALIIAQNNRYTLPNIQSDLLFFGTQIKLQEAINFRKHKTPLGITFKAPNQITKQECERIKENPLVTEWLNSYQVDWCK